MRRSEFVEYLLFFTFLVVSWAFFIIDYCFFAS